MKNKKTLVWMFVGILLVFNVYSVTHPCVEDACSYKMEPATCGAKCFAHAYGNYAGDDVDFEEMCGSNDCCKKAKQDYISNWLSPSTNPDFGLTLSEKCSSDQQECKEKAEQAVEEWMNAILVDKAYTVPLDEVQSCFGPFDLGDEIPVLGMNPNSMTLGQYLALSPDQKPFLKNFEFDDPFKKFLITVPDEASVDYNALASLDSPERMVEEMPFVPDRHPILSNLHNAPLWKYEMVQRAAIESNRIIAGAADEQGRVLNQNLVPYYGRSDSGSSLTSSRAQNSISTGEKQAERIFRGRRYARTAQGVNDFDEETFDKYYDDSSLGAQRRRQ